VERGSEIAMAKEIAKYVPATKGDLVADKVKDLKNLISFIQNKTESLSACRDEIDTTLLVTQVQIIQELLSKLERVELNMVSNRTDIFSKVDNEYLKRKLLAEVDKVYLQAMKIKVDLLNAISNMGKTKEEAKVMVPVQINVMAQESNIPVVEDL
jgi:hypothetical protein